MSVKTLALAVRTLRIDARSGARAWSRVGLVLLLLCALTWSVRYVSWVGAPGQRFFWWLVNLDFWFVTLLGVASFSGVITEEKEGMTLGLLELAGFDAVSILLGKSVGLLVSASLLLLVQLPFAMLSVTMGGVAAHQVAAAFTMLGCYLVTVYGVALLASTVCRRSHAAATLTAVSLFAWIAGPRLALGTKPSGWLEQALAVVVATEPYGALLDTAATGYAEPLLQRRALVALAVGGAAAACAWLVFRRLHRQEWRAGQSRGLLRGRADWPSASRPAASRPAPGPAALAWKDFRFLAGGPLLVGVRVLAYAALVVAYVCFTTGRWPRHDLFRLADFAAPFLCLLLCLESAALASRFLLEEVKWQTLPALASLPYPLRTWVWAKARGCAIVLVPITLLVAGAFLVMLLGSRGIASYLVAHAVLVAALAILAVHVAAYSSLRLRWGSLAVAGVATVVCLVTTKLLVLYRPGTYGLTLENLFAAASLVYLAISLLLHRAILSHLR